MGSGLLEFIFSVILINKLIKTDFAWFRNVSIHRELNASPLNRHPVHVKMCVTNLYHNIFSF